MFMVRRFAALLAVPVWCAFAPSSSGAQSVTSRSDSTQGSLQSLVGSELRVHSDRRLVEGRLVLVLQPDTMLLQTQRSDTLSQVAVPLQCVRTMEQLAGRYSAKQSAWRGGLIGFLIGAGVGGAARIVSGNRGDELGAVTHIGNGTAAVGVIALLSGGVGALIGSKRGVERWTSIPVPAPSAAGSITGPACDNAGF
jgi:hypothetical protein